jgi:CxxC motif-containing protein (DUF1111 family)
MQSSQVRYLTLAAIGTALALALLSLQARAADGLSVEIGKRLFKRIWVPAPSSTEANDGLGPLFNARSCAQCHRAETAGLVAVEKNGELAERGAVVRLSKDSGAIDSNYGAQIQTRAIPQFDPEAHVHLTWEKKHVGFSDGTSVELRKPHLVLRNFAYGPLDRDTRASLTVAPSLAVAAEIARVDTSALPDKNASGRLIRSAAGAPAVFGRKQSDKDIAAAAALAFSRDLGMSTPLYPSPAGDCTSTETACLAAPNGAGPKGVEIGAEIVSALVAYVEALPAPTKPDETNALGKMAFEAAECEACHQPIQKGRDGAPLVLYSDLLLHDMGEALAGPAEPGGASAFEWRTAPLIGLKERLAAGATLLHDGRARSIEEAILWHAGAAQAARDRYVVLKGPERAALAQFLEGK